MSVSSSRKHALTTPKSGLGIPPSGLYHNILITFLGRKSVSSSEARNQSDLEISEKLLSMDHKTYHIEIRIFVKYKLTTIKMGAQQN